MLAAVFAIGVAILTYRPVTALNQDMATTQREMGGSAFLRPTVSLLQNRDTSDAMTALNSEIVTSLDSVSSVVEENTAAIEAMAASSSEVTGSIESIASVSKENSAAVEEVSASTEEMSAQVEELAASARSLGETAADLETVICQFMLRSTTGHSPAAVERTQQIAARKPQRQFAQSVS